MLLSVFFFFLHTSDAIADVKEVQVSLRQLELQMIAFENTKKGSNSGKKIAARVCLACAGMREQEGT